MSDGLTKLVSTIRLFASPNIPQSPHPLIMLLHSRVKYALDILANDLFLVNCYSSTDLDSFSYGISTLHALFCNIIIRPGPEYNKVIVTPAQNGIRTGGVAHLSVSFAGFLNL